jgi:Bacterial SH3 domain
VPRFGPGELVVTAIDGLRVRQRPGLSANVVTGLLPLGAELEVVMGPIPADGQGWYLVADADPADPEFDEGWIAAGFDPEAFIATTGERARGTRFLASLAHTGDAEDGPVEIRRGDHAIRWVAVDPEGTDCRFAVSLAEGGAEPVPAIRATIGNDVVPGTLQPNGFDALGVRGQVFVSVVSDCAWALVIERVPESERSGG